MFSTPACPSTLHPSQMRRLDYSHDIPPLGCNPDAMKLFVGNIPKSYTAESLRPLFESIGSVVELVVVRDKLTDESKGSAFVWYQTRVEAERAIAELHLRRVLQDPTGEQDRPLVVRRANPKVPPVILPSALLPQTSFLGGGGGYPDMDIPAQLQGAFPGTGGAPSRQPLESQFSLGSTPSQLIPMVQELGMTTSPGGGQGTAFSNAEQLLSRLSSGQNLSSYLDPSISSSLLAQPPTQPTSMFPAFSSLNGGVGGGIGTTPPTSSANLSSVLASSLNLTQNNAASLGFGQMTLSLNISRSQGSVLGGNLHNIQRSSGAMIHLMPGHGESYAVTLSGNDSQLESAKNMVHELVAQSAL
eukprot:g255.t1